MYSAGKSVYTYLRIKLNTQSSIYEMTPFVTGQFLTKTVKVEKFQGFSKASHISEYFRTYGTTWAKGEQVTGFFSTGIPNVFFGDRKANGTRTLLLFKFNDSRDHLTVHVYDNGYYPSRSVIEQLGKGV
jgi:hypothetical protein